jgi:hypothetical protein
MTEPNQIYLDLLTELIHFCRKLNDKESNNQKNKDAQLQNLKRGFMVKLGYSLNEFYVLYEKIRYGKYPIERLSPISGQFNKKLLNTIDKAQNNNSQRKMARSSSQFISLDYVRLF